MCIVLCSIYSPAHWLSLFSWYILSSLLPGNPSSLWVSFLQYKDTKETYWLHVWDIYIFSYKDIKICPCSQPVNSVLTCNHFGRKKIKWKTLSILPPVILNWSKRRIVQKLRIQQALFFTQKLTYFAMWYFNPKLSFFLMILCCNELACNFDWEMLILLKHNVFCISLPNHSSQFKSWIHFFSFWLIYFKGYLRGKENAPTQ